MILFVFVLSYQKVLQVLPSLRRVVGHGFGQGVPRHAKGGLLCAPGGPGAGPGVVVVLTGSCVLLCTDCDCFFGIM